jgi:TonB family protein
MTIREQYMPGPTEFCLAFVRMRRMNALIIFLLALSSWIAVAQESPIAVSKEDATAHLVKKVEPIVPPLAKAVHVGGTVVLSIVISTDGKVTSTTVVSGHPLLIQAALDAVRQWTYKPFENGGKTVPAKTQVELLLPGERSKEEEQINQKYFKLEDECRSLLNAKKYEEGETKCRESVKFSDALPTDAVLERSNGRTLLGHTIYLQGRAADAIPIYADALKLDQEYLKDNDADLASDYANSGRAYAKTGDLAKADSLYATSVRTFKAAILNLPTMKANYTSRLK